MRSRGTLIGILISVVSLAGVVWWASRQEPPELPDTAGQLAALGLAVGLYALSTVVRAERWHALLHRGNAEPSRADSYALTVVGYTGNNVLPARAGDAVRAVLLAPRAATSVRTVVGTLVAERLLDVAILIPLFLLLGYGILGAAGVGDVGTLAAVTGLALLVAGLGVVMLRRNERLMRWTRPLLASTLGLRGGHGAAMLSATALIWAIEAGVWTAVGRAVDLDTSLIEGAYLVALASVFALIPSGPGYAGTQDAAVAIGVKALGGSGSAAVSYLVMLRFVLIVPITLLGFVLLATRYGGISRLRSARLAATRESIDEG